MGMGKKKHVNMRMRDYVRSGYFMALVVVFVASHSFSELIAYDHNSVTRRMEIIFYVMCQEGISSGSTYGKVRALHYGKKAFSALIIQLERLLEDSFDNLDRTTGDMMLYRMFMCGVDLGIRYGTRHARNYSKKVVGEYVNRLLDEISNSVA